MPPAPSPLPRVRRALHVTLAATLLAVWASGCSPGASEPPPAARPDALHDATLTEHPDFPVQLRLPAGWSSDPAPDRIIPSGAWYLRAPGDGTDGASLRLVLGWRPRRGRQSAFFPGGREGDARAGRVRVLGAMRDGLFERDGRVFLADFDAGELVLGVRAYDPAGLDGSPVLDVLESLSLGPDADRPADDAPRRALDAAERFARDRGWDAAGLLHTPTADSAWVHFTTTSSGLLAGSRLHTLRVHAATGRVEETGP